MKIRMAVAMATVVFAAGCGGGGSSSSVAGTLAFNDGNNQPKSAYEQPMNQLTKRCRQSPDDIGATVMATKKDLKQAGRDATDLAVLTSIAEVAAASSDKGKVDCDQVARTLVKAVKGR